MSLSSDDLAILLNSTRNDLSDLQESFQSLTAMVNGQQDNVSYAIAKTSQLEATDLRLNTNINSALAQVSSAVTIANQNNSTIANSVLPGVSTLQSQTASAIQANTQSVAYVNSVVPAIQSDISLLKTEYSAVSSLQVANLAHVESEIASANDAIASVNTRVDFNASSIIGLQTLTTSQGNTIATHTINLQSLIDGLQAVTDRDSQAYQLLETVQQQTTANTSFLNSSFSTTGMVGLLQSGLSTTNGTVSTISAKQGADESILSNISTAIIPGVTSHLSTLDGQVGAINSAEKWSQFIATQNANMGGYRLVNVSGINYSGGNIIMPLSTIGVETGVSYPSAMPSTFNYSHATPGIYNGKTGLLVASEAGVTGATLNQSYWYLAVHTSTIQGIRMYDGRDSANVLGGNILCPITQFGLTPDGLGNQLYGAMFQVPKSWHLDSALNASIVFKVFEVLSDATGDNSNYQRVFNAVAPVVKRNTAYIEVIDTLNNPLALNILSDNKIYLTQPGGITSYATLPQYNDSAIWASANASASHLTSVDSQISSISSLVASEGVSISSAISSITGLSTLVAPYNSRISSCEALIPTVASQGANISSLQSTAIGQAGQLSALTTRVGIDENNISTLQQTVSSQGASLSAITTSGVASHWSQNVALQTVDLAQNSLINVSSISFVPGTSQPLLFKEPTSGNKWSLATTADNEGAVRMVRQNTAGALQTGYLLDSLLNPPQVRSPSPGQLQVRCLVPGGSGLTYIGTANNISPRSALTGGAFTAVPFDGTQQLVWSGQVNSNIYTGAGIYQFNLQLQVCQNGALFAPAIGPADFGLTSGFNIVIKFSTDNTNWTAFSKGTAYGFINGITDFTYLSNELTTATAPNTSASVVYFRIYVTANNSTQDYIGLSTSPTIIQFR